MLRAKKRTVIAGVAVVAAAAATVAGFQVAQADTNQAHYYFQVGGTGAAADAPECTGSYKHANEAIEASGGTPVPICYPASIAPVVGSHNEMPAPGGTPVYDDSVQQGVDHTVKAINDTHAKDPDALFTVVGYSQGGDVADRVLEMIANGETDVPKKQVNGKLYADPRQPETGLWAKIPAGTSVAGITSPGAGPTDFAGIPVERHCIAKDVICDAQPNPEHIMKYLTDHASYQVDNDIIESTIAEPSTNEVVWHD